MLSCTLFRDSIFILKSWYQGLFFCSSNNVEVLGSSSYGCRRPIDFVPVVFPFITFITGGSVNNLRQLPHWRRLMGTRSKYWETFNRHPWQWALVAFAPKKEENWKLDLSSFRVSDFFKGRQAERQSTHVDRQRQMWKIKDGELGMQASSALEMKAQCDTKLRS